VPDEIFKQVEDLRRSGDDVSAPPELTLVGIENEILE
jgi:hypothetical protein